MKLLAAARWGLACVALALPLLPLLGLAAASWAPAPRLFAGGADADWSTLLTHPSGGPGPLVLSGLLALCVGAVALPLGTLFAWAERRWTYPGARVLGLLTLLPLAIPSYVLAGTLRQTLGPGGWLGGPLGLPVFSGFWAAALVLILTTTPYVQLLVGAALARAGADEEEAARVLGARGWRRLRVAVLPRLRPALAFSLLLVQLYVVSDFGAVAVLDCQALTWRLYQAVNMGRFDLAFQLGCGVMALTIPLLVFARLVRGKSGVSGGASQRPVARRRPSSFSLVGLVPLQVGAAFLGGLVPVLTLVLWVREGLARDLPFESLAEPAWTSTWLALVGALLTTALALAPAWLSIRSPRLLAKALEQGTYLASSLPGVLLAFGILLAALHGSRLVGVPGGYAWLLGTGALLFMGYATRFLAEAFACLQTGVALLDPELEESGRVLGAGAGRLGREVIAPQLAPTGAVALALCAIAIVKELPVTLLLGGPLGLRPLSFRMYDRYTEALYHDAGLAGLALVALGAAGFALTLWWHRNG